jgi:hypothetical protein
MSPATETRTVEPTPLLEREALSELPVEHLCDFSVDLEPAQPIATPVGAQMVFIVKGGTVDGPKLKGEVLPGGGDWVLVGDDRVGRADIRATIRSDDGALLHYTAGGVLLIPADGPERLAAGERLPFEETYARTTPKFETSHEDYSWLNRLTVVTHSELSKDHVNHRLYALL